MIRIDRPQKIGENRAMNLSEFLQRADSARATPTLYWLGQGGWTRADQARGRQPAQPGRPFDVRRGLATMQVEHPDKHAEYMKELARSGLSMESLPGVACDCSGFVTWALGVARDSGPWGGEGWISTDDMYRDARGDQRLFRPVDRAAPGTVIVYPKPPGQGKNGLPGHVGIVTEVSSDGRPLRVLHCAPRSYLLEPPPGLPRNAIAETGTEHFDSDPRTILVAWRHFEG